MHLFAKPASPGLLRPVGLVSVFRACVMNQIYCEDITLTPPRVRFADSSAEHSCCAEKSTKSIDLRQSQLLHRCIFLQKKKKKSALGEDGEGGPVEPQRGYIVIVAIKRGMLC